MPTVETEVEVEVEVWCAKCGAGLCNQTSVESRRGTPAFRVEPCERCLEEANQKGYDEGYDEGYEAREKEVTE